jgi:spoIIIJ-associated protein
VSEEINDVIVEEVDLDEAAEAVEPDAEVVAETAAESAAEGEDEASEEAGGDEDVNADGTPRSKKESVLETEGEIAADYLEELLDIADLDGDIDTFIEGGRAHVSIITEGDVLVGKDGEVLEALQELARLAVMTETGHRSRLMLDVAGHRDKRRKVLQDLAKDAVDEVNDSGEAVRLAPMNPFERKIVHDSVAAAGLISESEGEEPQRRVVVLPKA